MAGISLPEKEAILNESIDHAGTLLLRKTKVLSFIIDGAAASPFTELRVEQAKKTEYPLLRSGTQITVSSRQEPSNPILKLQNIFAILVEQLNERAPATLPWFQWTGDPQDEA